jgi:hypothetical protein
MLYCMDTLGQHETGSIAVGIYNCQSGGSMSQFFSYSHKDQIRREDLCAISTGKIGEKLYLSWCNDNDNQKWIHTKFGHIKNKKTGLCLDRTGVVVNNHVKINECSSINGQNWTFANYIDPLPILS